MKNPVLIHMCTSYSRGTKIFVADVKMAAVCLHCLHNKKYCPNFNIVCLTLYLVSWPFIVITSFKRLGIGGYNLPVFFSNIVLLPCCSWELMEILMNCKCLLSLSHIFSIILRSGDCAAHDVAFIPFSSM